jgi:hypothetical protein
MKELKKEMMVWTLGIILLPLLVNPLLEDPALTLVLPLLKNKRTPQSYLIKSMRYLSFA